MNGKSLALAAFAASLVGVAQGFQKALILPRLDEDGVRRVVENGYDGAELRLHGETVAEAQDARALADRSGVKLYKYENTDHSLETKCMPEDLRILGDVIDKLSVYLK